MSMGRARAFPCQGFSELPSLFLWQPHLRVGSGWRRISFLGWRAVLEISASSLMYGRTRVFTHGGTIMIVKDGRFCCLYNDHLSSFSLSVTRSRQGEFSTCWGKVLSCVLGLPSLKNSCMLESCDNNPFGRFFFVGLSF